ncbi:MAG: CoA transferase, partial [Hyphomicrobiales bacterium]
MLALEGLRVIEFGRGRMAAYAGKLLAEFGAEVTLLTDPTGARERTLFGMMPDCERAALAEFLDERKVAIDIEPGREREVLEPWLASADILLLERHIPELDALGLSPESISARFPELVVVVCSLGGLTPSGRGLRHSDLVASAIGGIASRTPARHPNHLDEPPLKIGGYQADYATGLVAASAALVTLQQRRRGARNLLCDVSAHAAMASFMRWEAAFALYN